MTGEHLAQPLWRADPRSKLDSAPLAHALRALAGERGLGEVEALARYGRAALGGALAAALGPGEG
jgi:hypothetical protein